MAIEYPAPSWKDYELLDSGNGWKLERFGPYRLMRPEPKALWRPDLSENEWNKLSHTRFSPGAGFGRAGKEDSGTWERLKKTEDQWAIRYEGYGPAPVGRDGGDGAPAPAESGRVGGPTFSLRLGLTAFKHVGVFPEQAPNWEFIYRQTRALAEKVRLDAAAAGRPFVRPKVLNLFAYTGAASLAACAAGADVTHLDAVRQVVTWARGNMERSELDGIRWVVEDALKFARREARRGNRYQGIILDPPAYGHGPDGEKWKLDECLFDLLECVAGILDPDRRFLVLNLYSNGYSPMLGETLVRQAFGSPSMMQSGELCLRDRFGKVLPLSIYVRLGDAPEKG